MKTIVIIDYESGNLHSVERAAKHVSKHPILLSNNPKIIAEADAVIFPGQGAAKQCMSAIATKQLTDSITDAAKNKPFFGICMGLQVLMDYSQEDGYVEGLGVIKGSVCRLTSDRLKIPHMGWNQIQQRDHPLWHGIENNAYFYFVHSYFIAPDNDAVITGTCHYGEEFCCSIGHKQLFGIQAHPEKSGSAGLQLLSNFCNQI